MRLFISPGYLRRVMIIDFSEINHLTDPSFQCLHADYEQFLLSLSGPSIIDITGLDESSTQVITTLLQGNEPSGFIAIHRWLTERNIHDKPKTNLRFIICSVEPALKRPLFSHKMLPTGIDLNRCFNTDTLAIQMNSNEGYYHQRAKVIEQAIREVNPVTIVDLHNTSSPSPAYVISSTITTDTLLLTSFFCQSLILSDLKIGSLIDLSFNCPFITVECGYAFDVQAHEIAYKGIVEIANTSSLSDITQEKTIDVKYQPLRLRLKEGVNISFAEFDEGNRGITLKSNIDYFNFGHIYEDEMIGWTDTNGLKNLELSDLRGKNIVDEYFYIRDNQLVCKHTYQLLKATTNINSAKEDCLFYVVKVNGVKT
jgi:hypothetical protein